MEVRAWMSFNHGLKAESSSCYYVSPCKYSLSFASAVSFPHALRMIHITTNLHTVDIYGSVYDTSSSSSALAKQDLSIYLTYHTFLLLLSIPCCCCIIVSLHPPSSTVALMKLVVKTHSLLHCAIWESLM